MESPNLFLAIPLFLSGKEGHKDCLVNIVLFSLFVIHYIHRDLLYPLKMKSTATPMPISIAAMAFLYTSCNSIIQVGYLANVSTYEISWLYDPRFILGTLIWATGMYINVTSDNKLINLRKEGEKGYKIPRGGLFDYVTSPNLFGEIVEWMGFAVACWNRGALLFALYVFANLFPRGISHHKWYLEKFKEYPKNRKAVIPFVY